MAENITSLYDIYNMANDAGKATDIQSNDLFYLQRGTGSDRDKVIKGSDMKLSSALVIAAAGDTVPGNLINKLDNSGDIAFDDFNAASGKKIKATIKTNVVDADHLKSNSVTNAKIAEGAVTESKIALNSIQEQAIKDGAVTTSKLGDGSVSNSKLQNNSVSGGKIDSSVIDVQNTVNIDFSVDLDGDDFDHRVYQFSGVGQGGIIDINLYVIASASTYMSDVKFEIRKSGSSTADREWDIGTLSQDEMSRRLVVKNGTSSLVNYELHIVGKLTSSVPSGLSGFMACKVDIRGFSIA